MGGYRQDGPRRVRGLLDGHHGELAGLRQQTRSLDRATQGLSAAVPARLEGHWRVAALSTDALVVAVDSPVWATALRTHQQALLDAAGELQGTVPRRIRIRVLTPRTPPRPAPRQQSLSPSAAENLEEAARAADDPRLAAALRRLAARRRK